MLCPRAIGPVPDETARVARGALPADHPYLRLADELGTLFTDELFQHLYPTHGQPALAPWRLALVTLLQFAEGLSDRQAVSAVRSRIDWKYVLRLELDDPGFDASVLCEFRARLLAGGAEQLLLETLLAWCRERQLIKAGGRQRTDSTHVWAAVRGLNRLALIIEAMRHALNSLAVIAPTWLQLQADPAWVERYRRRAEHERLPTKIVAQEELALVVGGDGYRLLAALYDAEHAPWLREIPAVETLRRVWIQNYTRSDDEVQWRGKDDLPPSAMFISSPYDPDAHLAARRTMQWVGYKVHFTETCDDDLPPLIVHAATTAAPVADGDLTPTLHAALAEQGLLPKEHVVDTGYLDAALLVRSRTDYGVDLIGPTRSDYHWQAQERTGFAVEHFEIDWDQRQATCPEGKTSISWTPAVDSRTNQVIKIKFSARDCRHCASRTLCTRSQKRSPRRTITIRAREEFEALLAARERAQTDVFAATYAKRAGCEGTVSRGVRTCGLRRTRYIGHAKAHLGHILTAAGLNFLRLGEWFAGYPPVKTRHSPFATLMAGSMRA